MATRKVDINVAHGAGPRAAFAPGSLQALVGDLVSWANNDPAQPHWPAPIINGTVNNTGFMTREIPPNASSLQSFSPSESGTIAYRCVRHADETGSIVVTDSPAADGIAAAAAPTARPAATPKPPSKPKPKPKPKPKRTPKPRAKSASKPKAKRRTASKGSARSKGRSRR